MTEMTSACCLPKCAEIGRIGEGCAKWLEGMMANKLQRNEDFWEEAWKEQGALGDTLVIWTTVSTEYKGEGGLQLCQGARRAVGSLGNEWEMFHKGGQERGRLRNKKGLSLGLWNTRGSCNLLYCAEIQGLNMSWK